VGCPKGAVSGGTLHCQAHGGGRHCQHAGCSKAVALDLPAVCNKSYASSASSPTMRRTMHRNSVTRSRRGIEELVRELRRRVESAGAPTG
jgi:hypothetical protein